MNELDQFVKHKLKPSYYIRYCDDFLLVSLDRQMLEEYLVELRDFLQSELQVEIHSDKIVIRKYSSGIDFLGFVCFPYHQIVRTRTRRRLLRRVNRRNASSYLGLIQHARSKNLRKQVLQSINAIKLTSTDLK